MKRSSLYALYELWILQDRRNVFLFSAVISINVISALMEGMSFASLFMAISYLNGESTALPFGGLNRFLPQALIGASFMRYLLAALGFQIIQSFLTSLASYISSFLVVRIQETTQQKVLDQILRFSYPFVLQYKTGDLTEYAKSPTVVVSTIYDHLSSSMSHGFVVLVQIFILSKLSFKLMLVAFALFFVASILNRNLIGKIAEKSKEYSSSQATFVKEIVQACQAMRLIHIFNRAGYILSQTKLTLHSISQSTRKMTLYRSLFSWLNETLNFSVVALLLIFGFFLHSGSKENLAPTLITFLGVSYRLANRLQACLAGIAQLASHVGSLHRIVEILTDEGKEYAPKGGIPIPTFNHSIEFKNVTHTYPALTDPALSKINLTIRKGNTIGIVGSSGAGKSTLLDLLLRLYEPSSGEIRVDGIPLASIETSSWRDLIGVVSQDIILLNESIAENILFGKIGASPEAVIAAAIKAGAHQFISQLPNQYDTVIGERGYKLSGGERQRISLARALVRNPQILILDEATSNLDSESERGILQSISELQHAKTILIVAHRLSTIVHSDLILVLEDGNIVEHGTHQELLHKGGRYSILWKYQAATQHEALLSLTAK